MRRSRIQQGQRGDHLPPELYRNGAGCSTPYVPAGGDRRARYSRVPYHQGAYSRSHPQAREPALGNRQDHLLRTDGFLFRDTHDLRGCGREQTEPFDRRSKGLQPREPLFQEDGGEIQGLHRLQEPRVL